MSMPGRAKGWLLAVGMVGALALTGCSGSPGTGSPSGEPAATGSQAEATVPSPGASTLPGLLASVDWPDDAETIAAVLEDLPEELSGLERFRYPPGPEMEARYDAYYGQPDAVGITLVVDPGSGITTPAHGMAYLVAYPGPQYCVDAEYSPVFDDLFQQQGTKAVLREVQRISELAPTMGELLWLICTQTADSDGSGSPATLPEDQWRYVAGWADGGWFYVASASSAQQRVAGVTALAAAVERATAG